MNGITVELEGLTHRYGTNLVLDQINLHIGGGARHAIVGANGAGKTTLLGLITGTARPSAGRILYDGRDVTRLPLHRRAQLGMNRTWQHPAIIESLTAADNVALAVRRPRLRSARIAASELLELAGLHDEADTPAGQLPYGRRRLLEIVTALAPRPRLLILDEPSAGLDEHETALLVERLVGVTATTTILMTDHSRALVTALATSVTVLDRGVALLGGPPSAVFADPRMSLTARKPPKRSAATPPAAVSTGREPAALRITHLNTGYRGHHVLRDVDITVHAGEVVAVVGPDGAGRSTLINAVAGTLCTWPHSSITVAGIDITRFTPAQRAKAGIGTVPQQRPPAPRLTVADQLRITASAVNQLPDDLLELAPWLPQRLRQSVDTLSGGERQMLAIACALARTPRVLLLDEAAEGLAAPVSTALHNLIRSMAARNVGVLLTDSLSGKLLNAADRAYSLRNGSLTPIDWTAVAEPNPGT